MPVSLSRRLARFAAPLSYDDLPPAVVDKVKALTLHGLVMSVVGAGTPEGKKTIELIKAEEGRDRGATILGDGAWATRMGAAFANSKLLHATNQSDSYRMLTHPGPNVIPAALGTAELEARSGREYMAAMAAGYETIARLARDFIPSTQARGFRSSTSYGIFGSAVATGKLLQLTEDQMVSAIAMAATYSGGTLEGQRTGGQEVMFHEPNATLNGILAALLAREGVKGSETALEGDAGFYNAFTGNNRGELSYVFTGPQQVNFDPVTEGLGQRWELLHTVLKMYPTAGYNCPIIDLMTDIREVHDLSIDDIERITIDMNWLETLYPSPAFPNASRGQAIVGSTHYFAAYVAVNGSYPPLRTRIDPGDDTDAAGAENHDAVIRLMQKVQTVGHKDRPAFAPQITIEMAGDNVYQGQYEGNELEWGLETEVERLRPLFRQIDWPHDKLEAVVAAVRAMPNAGNANELINAATH
jgi:hypothetical protein